MLLERYPGGHQAEAPEYLFTPASQKRRESASMTAASAQAPSSDGHLR